MVKISTKMLRQKAKIVVVSSDSSIFHPIENFLVSEGVAFSHLGFDEVLPDSFDGGVSSQPDVIICDLLIASSGDITKALLLKNEAELAGISVICISNRDITSSRFSGVREFSLDQIASSDLLDQLCSLDRAHRLSAVGQFV